jgi:hypothetical protein
MDNMDKAIIAMTTGLYLLGLPIFAGYLIGFYGVFMFFAVIFLGIIGR